MRWLIDCISDPLGTAYGLFVEIVVQWAKFRQWWCSKR